MYLALTNEEKNILKKKKIILLGEWCNSKEFFDYNFETIPYTIQNIDSAKKTNHYLYLVYVKFINRLSKELNKKNNLDKNEIVWEYLIGDWLWNFISIYFDRYSSLKNAFKNYDITEISIYKNIYLNFNYMEFYNLNQNDHFNHIIFSQIINKLNLNKKIKINVIDNNIADLKNLKLYERKPKTHIKFNLKFLLKYFYYKFIKYIAERTNIFFNINIPFGYLNKSLIKAIGDIFYVNFDNYIPPLTLHNFKNENRDFKIKYYDSDDEFEKILCQTVGLFIPQEYLENYKTYYKYYLKKIPKKIPKITGLRSPNEFSTEIRFMSSILKEKNSKILVCQEGGDGGSREHTLENEKINSRLCDIFLTWGWESDEKNFIPFHFTKLFWIKNYNYNKNGDVVLIQGTYRRFFLSMQVGQLPFYNNIQLNMTKNLISKLNPSVFKKSILRFHNQYGYGEIEKLKNKYKNIKISTREEESHFYRLLYNSRLIVVFIDFTTYKQSLVLNHPTILIWDKNYFSNRNKAKKYFDALHEAGILYYSEEECAKKINLIYENTYDWWHSDKVQNAKKYFMDYFCNYNSNVVNKLSNIIKSNNLN